VVSTSWSDGFSSIQKLWTKGMSVLPGPADNVRMVIPKVSKYGMPGRGYFRMFRCLLRKAEIPSQAMRRKKATQKKNIRLNIGNLFNAEAEILMPGTAGGWTAGMIIDCSLYLRALLPAHGGFQFHL